MSRTDKLLLLLTAIGMLGSLFFFYGNFTAQQAKIETQLLTIQRDIAELSISVNHREEAIHDLRERIALQNTRIYLLEVKIINLDRRLEYATR